MPDSDIPVDLSVPPLRRPEPEPDEKSPVVDLEELAMEVWALLKATLREENDRVGRV
jgi:hypothetical protein